MRPETAESPPAAKLRDAVEAALLAAATQHSTGRSGGDRAAAGLRVLRSAIAHGTTHRVCAVDRDALAAAVEDGDVGRVTPEVDRAAETFARLMGMGRDGCVRRAAVLLHPDRWGLRVAGIYVADLPTSEGRDEPSLLAIVDRHRCLHGRRLALTDAELEALTRDG